MKTDIDECIKRGREFLKTTSLVSAGAMKVGFEDSEQVPKACKRVKPGRQTVEGAWANIDVSTIISTNL